MLRGAHALAAVAFLSVLTSTGVTATTQRTFVASYGLTTNTAFNCSITKPCRGFSEAVGVTNSGGEVVVLDSAGYGPVTITQAVSIIAPAGVYAGISVFAALDGVTVAAGATDKVVLRGLTINGQGGNNGIRVLSVAELHIDDCIMTNLGMDGILVEGGSTVHVVRAVVRSNAGHGLHVISGVPAVQVSDSYLVGNGVHGVFIEAGEFNGSRLTVENNVGDGVLAQTPPSITINITLTDSVLTNNDVGFNAMAPSGADTVNAALNRVTARRNTTYGIRFVGNSGFVNAVVADSHVVETGHIGIYAVNGATVSLNGTTSAGNKDLDLYASVAIIRTTGTNSFTGRVSGDIFGTLTTNPQQ